MKKIISVTLCCIFIISALVFPASAVITNSETACFADANGDETVNALDAYSVCRYIAGFEDVDVIAADLNTDNKVSSADVFYLRSYLAGNVEKFGLTDAQIKKVTIGGVDLSAFSIIYDESVNENAEFAATQLSDYIYAATGRELPVFSSSDGVQGHVFYFNQSAELGKEGVDIKVEDGNVYITGGTKRGCMYATYEFLERYLGFVFINSDYEFNCAKNSVVIQNGSNYHHVPTMAFRDSMTYSYEGRTTESIEAALKLKISSIRNRGIIERSEKYGQGEGFIGSAHTMSDLAPHFVKDNSSKTCWNPDNGYYDEETEIETTMLEEVLENVCAKIKSAMAKGDVYDSISVSPMDNPEYCTCRYCKKINQAQGSTMGTHLTFINALARELAKIYPETHVLTTAYWIDRKPPKDMVCEDNVDILFCWAGCNNHLMDGSECYDEGNRLFYNNKLESSYFEKWCSICDRVYVWYYATSYYGPLAQPTYLDIIRENISYLNDHGVFGIYCEGFYGTDSNYKDGNCFDLLTMYMLARCMWNPDMTENEYNEYVNEFLSLYYGPGYDSVREYLEICDAATEASGKCWANNCDIVFDCIGFDYIKDNSETIISLVDEALAKAETADEVDHMEHLSASAYWQCLATTYESNYENGTEAQRTLYAERYQKLYDWMVKYPITNLDGLRGDFNPATCKDVMDPYSWLGINVYHNLKASKNPVDVYT